MRLKPAFYFDDLTRVLLGSCRESIYICILRKESYIREVSFSLRRIPDRDCLASGFFQSLCEEAKITNLQIHTFPSSEVGDNEYNNRYANQTYIIKSALDYAIHIVPEQFDSVFNGHRFILELSEPQPKPRSIPQPLVCCRGFELLLSLVCDYSRSPNRNSTEFQRYRAPNSDTTRRAENGFDSYAKEGSEPV